MKAVILAAGQGSRLRPLTEDRPKGMVEIAGKPIIGWQIDLLRRRGIEQIAIVTGYKASAVDGLGTQRFENPEYDSTNMVHSLFCADEFLDDDVLVSYGDILYSDDVLEQAMDSRSPISVVVDLDWERYFAERFGDPFYDAEGLILGESGSIASVGKPDPTPDEVQAQYVGLMRFSAHGVDLLRSIYAEASATNRPIGWGRAPRLAHMTDLLHEAAQRGNRLEAVLISGGWVEVDTLDDFEIANRLAPQLLRVPGP